MKIKKEKKKKRKVIQQFKIKDYNAKRCKLKAHELLKKIMLEIKLTLFH
jgi:hypothetical protein